MTRKNAARNSKKENAAKSVLEDLRWLNLFAVSFTLTIKIYPLKAFTKSMTASTRKMIASTIFRALGCPPGFIGEGC